MLSVVIPTLNAAAHLPRALGALMEGLHAGLIKEVIVVDGGSDDPTLAMADAAGCVVISAQRGRGGQLAAGAAAARGGWILFLHADTALEPGWSEEVTRFIERGGGDERAAAFRFALDDDSRAARRMAFWVGVRCRLFALPYGDQGLLIPASFYRALGGHRPFKLMEVVDLVRRIGRARWFFWKARAVTSGQTYRAGGYVRRGMRNVWLLMRYLAGADPDALAARYD